MTMNSDKIIPPGSTIGIVGGGQLGRMSAVAAAELGYRVYIFTPEENSPASEVAAGTFVGEYDDADAIRRFGESVDVVTFEFENVPAETVRRLSEQVPVRPNWECLAIAQDRTNEKAFADKVDVATAPWAEVKSVDDLTAAIETIGTPAILKTNSLGYDGKGQVRIGEGDDLARAWEKLGVEVGILEGFIDFDLEVSVITARGPDGGMESFDVVENRHVNGILDVTIAPAPLNDIMRVRAIDMAERMAEKLGLVGLLAVEMFVTDDGHLLMNEIAPRPHNSGHWTQDGCTTSQFEQFIRAVCGLPLGSTQRHSDTVMKNLIGNDADEWPEILYNPENKLHLYGKKEARPGRKMGHVNRLYAKGSNPEVD